MNQFTAEHSVVVNDEAAMTSPILTREQLWKGLVLRLVNPKLFNAQVEHCHIQWLNDRQFIRTQKFPSLEVEDKITLDPESTLQAQSLVSGDESFNLLITLNEDEENHLVVHFKYQRASANEGGLDVNNYLSEAYKHADKEAVNTIRALARSGEL